MKMTNSKRILSVILSFVLIAVIALTMYGCDKKTPEAESKQPSTEASSNENSQNADASTPTEAPSYLTFTFMVTHKDGSVSSYNVTSDKKYVGEALLESGYIAGDEGEYGLYVKTVDGETLDYDTDGMYWAFYENGVYASKGVDQTEIVAGKTYEFKAEK